MSEQKLHDKVRYGQEARALLENEVLQEALNRMYDAVEKRLDKKLDPEELVEAYQHRRAVRAFENSLNSILKEGKVAEHALERIQQAQETENGKRQRIKRWRTADPSNYR